MTKTTWGERASFSLWFQAIVHYWGGVKAGGWTQVLKQKPWGNCAYCLLLMVCKACFVIAPRMTNSGLAPLIVELDLPFHSSVKKTSIGQCGGAYLEWGSLFPNEPRTYVKVTKPLLAQSARKTKPRIVLRLLPNLWEHSLMVGLAVCVCLRSCALLKSVWD